MCELYNISTVLYNIYTQKASQLYIHKLSSYKNDKLGKEKLKDQWLSLSFLQYGSFFIVNPPLIISQTKAPLYFVHWFVLAWKFE